MVATLPIKPPGRKWPMESEATEHHDLADGTKSCGCAGGTGHACGCESCRAKSNARWVYTLGTIEPQPPNRSVRNELAQAIGRGDAKGLTDHQAFHAALSKPENRYLLRQLCWVFSVEHVESYILVPRDGDYMQLLEAIRPNPSKHDLDLALGILGPLAPPEACNGLRVPMLAFDQLYSFNRPSLLGSIPRPEKTSAKEFAPMAEEVLDRILQMTGNSGATDGDRACNYLAVRCPEIYQTAAEQFAKNASLTSVDVYPSPIGGGRVVVEFAYTNRTTELVEKFCVRVNVEGEFPYLEKKLSPCYGSERSHS
jgi:hypothetical protein